MLLESRIGTQKAPSYPEINKYGIEYEKHITNMKKIILFALLTVLNEAAL